MSMPRGRQTPDDMDLTLNETLHRENMRAFEYILKKCRRGRVAVGMGGMGHDKLEKRPYLERLRSRHGISRPKVRRKVAQCR